MLFFPGDVGLVRRRQCGMSPALSTRFGLPVFRVPPELPLGPVDTTLLDSDNRPLATRRIFIVPSSFGVFALGGTGSAAIMQGLQLSEPTLVQNVQPWTAAFPGQYLTVYGTGLGDEVDASVVAVRVGTPSAEHIVPLYAGPAPGQAGVDQINFRIPEDASLPEGCFVPLFITVNEFWANQAVFSTAKTPGPCPNPLQLSSETLDWLNAGNAIVVGVVTLTSFLSRVGRADRISAHFGFHDAVSVGRLTSADQEPMGCFILQDHLPAYTSPDTLDAGPQLNPLYTRWRQFSCMEVRRRKLRRRTPAFVHTRSLETERSGWRDGRVI